ncbi:MAG: site-specific integrase [bacterium]|nr:site-specific integrase [bacterium]
MVHRVNGSDRWYASVAIPGVRTLRVAAFPQKRQSENLERALERLVVLRAEGDRPDPEFQRYIDSLPDRTRRRLIKLRLLDDDDNVGRSRRLADVLGVGGRGADPGQFEVYLRSKGGTAAHARQQADRARRVLVGECHFLLTTDIEEGPVLQALAKLTHGGLSVSSRNAFRQACRSVTRWLLREGRLKRDPLLQLDKAQGDSDSGRRALSEEEQLRLVTVTRTQPTRGGLTGEARSLMYRLALTIGLRRGELLSLRRSDLVLNDKNPVVTVAHGHAKNRKSTSIPLQPDVASVLREFLRNCATPCLRRPCSEERARDTAPPRCSTATWKPPVSSAKPSRATWTSTPCGSASSRTWREPASLLRRRSGSPGTATRR